MSLPPGSSSKLLQLPEGAELEIVVVRLADGRNVVRTPDELEADAAAGREPGGGKGGR